MASARPRSLRHFLTSTTAIAKRLQRAKKFVAESRSLFEMTSADLRPRLESVQHALYLLFNEGYHGACPENSVREDLCREAMRLVGLLTQHPQTASPSTFALAALMHLHAARLSARVDGEGELIPFFQQDRVNWDAGLMKRGSPCSTNRLRARSSARFTSKRRSPLVTRRRRASKILLGCASCPSTICCSSSTPRR